MTPEPTPTPRLIGVRRKLHHAAVGAEALDGLRQMVIPILVVLVLGGGGNLATLIPFGLVIVVFAVVVAYAQWSTA